MLDQITVYETLSSAYMSLHVMLWSNETPREDIMPLHSWPACNVNLWLLPLQACFTTLVALQTSVGELESHHCRSANAEGKLMTMQGQLQQLHGRTARLGENQVSQTAPISLHKR